MKAEIQFGKIRKVRGENIRVNGLIVCPTLRIGIVMYYVSEMPVSICMYRDRYIKFAGGFYVAFKNSIYVIIIIVFCPRAGSSLQAQEPRLHFCQRQVFHLKLRNQGCSFTRD